MTAQTPIASTPRNAAFRTCQLAAAALVAALLPLAAAAQTAEETPTTDAPAQWEVEDRVDRPEEGAMSGTVVLIDRENLILETADGDRAFAFDNSTRLPDVLRASSDWSEVEGFPVEVVFRSGADGELRIVESLSVLPIESQESAEPEVESVVANNDENGARPAALASAGPGSGGPANATASALRPGEPGTTDSAAGRDSEPSALRSVIRELPRTASSLPWIGLIGLFALGSAFGLGAVSRKA